jgi:hypothetical protein
MSRLTIARDRPTLTYEANGQRGTVMSCTKEALGVRWEQHAWRRRVSHVEHRSSPKTDMWGRVFVDESVFCHKQDVCETCGQTRENADCTCDTEKGERCPLLLASVGPAGETLA